METYKRSKEPAFLIKHGHRCRHTILDRTKIDLKSHNSDAANDLFCVLADIFVILITVTH